MAFRDWPIRVFTAAAALFWSFVDILAFIGHAAWRFVDLPSFVTTALGHLARSFVVLRQRSTAFVAFCRRALTHDLYVAGRFDPCRMPT